MLEVMLRFSLEDARRLMESAGLAVEIRETPTPVKQYHDRVEMQLLPVWCVINPHTGTPEPLKDTFSRYLENRKKQLFLNCENRLEIFSLFDKKAKP